MFRSEQPIKQIMPMIRESSSLPRTKPEKMRSTVRVPRITASAFFSEKAAYTALQHRARLFSFMPIR